MGGIVVTSRSVAVLTAPPADIRLGLTFGHSVFKTQSPEASSKEGMWSYPEREPPDVALPRFQEGGH